MPEDRFNEHQISQLYADHAGSLHRFIHGKLGCTETAADISQDIFLRLCCLDGASAIDDARSYLFRMARNMVVDHFRRTVNERTRCEKHDISELVELSDDSPACEEQAMLDEQLRSLYSMMQEWSHLSRNIFTLRHIAGYKNREVADHLGVCLSTVEKRLAAVRGHCAQHIHFGEKAGCGTKTAAVGRAAA